MNEPDTLADLKRATFRIQFKKVVGREPLPVEVRAGKGFRARRNDECDSGRQNCRGQE